MSGVGIIGTGRLGTRLAEELIRDSFVELIALENRTSTELTGTLEALAMWRDLIGARAEITTVDNASLKALDIIVVVAKERYDPRNLMNREWPDWLPIDLRYIGLLEDISTLRSIAERLSRFNGIVMIVTNPVDVLTTLFQRWLPSATVLGAGVSLDAARLSCMMARRLGGSPSQYHLPVAGEHGDNMVPLVSQFEVPSAFHDKSLQCLTPALQDVRRFGKRVVELLGFTVHDCALVLREDIRWLLDGECGVVRCFSSTGNVSDCDAAVGSPFSRESGKIVSQLEALPHSERMQIAAAGRAIGKLLEEFRSELPSVFG